MNSPQKPYWELEPVTLKRYALVINILASILLLMSLLLCLALWIAGVIGILFSCFFFRMGKKYKTTALQKEDGTFAAPTCTPPPQAPLAQKNTPISPKSQHFKPSPKTYSFPEVDARGKRALVMREADIYGVGKTFNGISAQETIAALNIGDDIFFKISKSGTAVNVLDPNGIQFGYLPEWKSLDEPKVKVEVYNRLASGATVLAKVKSKYTNKNGKIGVIIDICRYAL